MKRHPALVPLSHDHHHGLVQARHLHRAAAEERASRRAAAAAFLGFFTADTRRHFRDEEETIFPLLVDGPHPAAELLAQVLLEHQRIRALVARLDQTVAAGEPPPALMRELAETLENHIRLEERRLFPLLEQLAPADVLDQLDVTGARPEPQPPVVDLDARHGRGPVWGTESEDLNVTLLVWAADEGSPEHVNSERDVFLVVLAGNATVTIDGGTHAMEAGDAVMIARGHSRRITAGHHGVRYLTVHRRRPPLTITSRR